jgi:poly(A) polymerase
MAAAKIREISAERVRDELLKTLCPPHAARGFQLLQESGLLLEILPELEATVGCEQSPDFHPEGSVFNHICKMLELLSPESGPELTWAVLLHDVGKPVTAVQEPGGRIRFPEHERVGAKMAAEILERLRFPRKFSDSVIECVRFHMQFLDAPAMRRSTLRRMLMRPHFRLELELHRLDSLGSNGRLATYDFVLREQRAFEAQPELIPPLLSGRDLIELGVTPGPTMGLLLTELRDRQLQGELRNRHEALVWIREKLT